MAPLAFCVPCGPDTRLEASAYLDAIGLEQLLFGEWPIGVGHRGTLVPDVNTAVDDWPCLVDVLRECSRRTAQAWLLLLTAEALPSLSLIQVLKGFLATQPGPHLVLGRAWRVSSEHWELVRNFGPWPGQDLAIKKVLRMDGTLDPPDEISWMLFPKGSWADVAATRSAAPWRAAPWLMKCATESGWPVLDATWAAPLLRPRSVDPALPARSRRWIRTDGSLSAGGPGSPRISFLLVANPEQLRCWQDQLLPTSALPWEVVVRSLPEPCSETGVVASWNAALPDATGDLVWPLWNAVPRLGLVPTLLRCFQPAWVDLVTMAFRIGSQLMPASDPIHIRPGTLVVRRGWLERLGGFPRAATAEGSLLRLRRESVARGAMVHPLPIDAW